MARAELAYAARREVWLASKAAMHDVTMALRKLKGASHESEVGLAVATDDADPEALEDEAFNAAMESAELDGLEGEEAELAAWERAAGALADRMDNNRQTMAGGRPGLEVDLDCVHWTLMPPPTARIPTNLPARSCWGSEWTQWWRRPAAAPFQQTSKRRRKIE